MDLKRALQYLPLAVLVMAVIYSIYTTLTTNIALVDRHYLGICFVLVGLVAEIRKSIVGKVVTFIALLLGSLNLLAFTPVIEAYSFGFSLNNVGLDLRVQPFSLWIFLVFIIVNFKTIGRFLQRVFNDKKDI